MSEKINVLLIEPGKYPKQIDVYKRQVLQSPDERDTEQSSVGSPAEGDRVGGDAYQADGTARGSDEMCIRDRYFPLKKPMPTKCDWTQ